MSDKEKIERLMCILERAIGELREGAEDWFQEEILDLIGTNEEELKALGFRIVP